MRICMACELGEHSMCRIGKEDCSCECRPENCEEEPVNETN